MATKVNTPGFTPIQSAREFGLPAEFNDDLFTNLQANVGRARQAGRQQILGSGGRFPQLGSGQGQQLRGLERGIADKALETGVSTQLQGVREQLTDRRTDEGRQFTAQQSELMRNLQDMLNQRGIDFSDRQLQENVSQRNRDRVAEIFGGGLGFLGGLAGGED